MICRFCKKKGRHWPEKICPECIKNGKIKEICIECGKKAEISFEEKFYCLKHSPK